MTETRAKLRAYLAERKDASHGVDNVAAWIEALGTALGKQDIVDGAGALAVYMVTTKGFTAGEEFTTAELADIEEAAAVAQVTLSDISTRTIWRYMHHHPSVDATSLVSVFGICDLGRKGFTNCRAGGKPEFGSASQPRATRCLSEHPKGFAR